MEPTVTLLGALFKLIDKWIGILTNRAERRITAGVEFRNTFITQLQGLYPGPVSWPKAYGIDPTLRKVFPVLQTAYTKYRPFVPKSDKAAFDLAWRDYRCHTKRDQDIQDYTNYINFATVTTNAVGGQAEIKRDGKAAFKRNVDRLLAFAARV